MADPITSALSEPHGGPVLVHSDLRGLLLQLGPDVRRVMRESGPGDGIMNLLMDRLNMAVGDRELWIPAYNYDFCKTGIYRVSEDPAQIGALPEYYRNNEAEWRTATPVFSVCGSGPPPTATTETPTDPFGVESEFDQLCQRDGLILFFGVQFSPTVTHYVERMATSDGPLYRYDKLFHGEVETSTSESHPVTLKYHVIPRGVMIKYDMVRLQRELLEAGEMRALGPEYGKTFVVPAQGLVRFWKDRLRTDPYYLLDSESRKTALAIVEEFGGSRLHISNFNDADFPPSGDSPTRGVQ